MDGSHNNLHSQLHRQLHNLCAEMGLEYPDIVPLGGTADSSGGNRPLFRASDMSSSAGAAAAVADSDGSRARENYRIRLLEARK